MATPIDLTQVFGMLFQLLPFIIILAILPLVIKLVTQAFGGS